MLSCPRCRLLSLDWAVDEELLRVYWYCRYCECDSRTDY
jgi:hypothetical protein